jgi:hypothetical protein
MGGYLAILKQFFSKLLVIKKSSNHPIIIHTNDNSNRKYSVVILSMYVHFNILIGYWFYFFQFEHEVLNVCQIDILGGPIQWPTLFMGILNMNLNK